MVCEAGISPRAAQAATPVAMPCSAGAPNIMPVVGGKRGLSKAVFSSKERIEQCWCSSG